MKILNLISRISRNGNFKISAALIYWSRKFDGSGIQSLATTDLILSFRIGIDSKFSHPFYLVRNLIFSLFIFITVTNTSLAASVSVIGALVPGEYTTYDLKKDKGKKNSPRKMGRNGSTPTWKGLKGVKIQASIVHPVYKKIYLFSNKRYYRYDLAGNKIEKGYPRLIGKDGWRGVWKDGIDAALVSPNKKKIYSLGYKKGQDRPRLSKANRQRWMERLMDYRNRCCASK